MVYSRQGGIVMKRVLLIVFTMAMLFSFSMISYAGEWKQDEMGWRYQNDDGTYKTGWYQDVDGKWYYLDNQTTYLLVDTVTPDGYSVSSTGEWIEEAVNDIRDKDYDNKVELKSTAYSFPGGARSIGYEVLTTVYFNDEYVNTYNEKVKVSKVELSKSGVPYIVCNVPEYDVYYLTLKCKYVFDDGSSVDSEDRIYISSKCNGEEASSALLKPPSEFGKGPKWTSVEIYVNEGTFEY